MMAKRRRQYSNTQNFDSEDRPIGLTGAFAPVKGPQSVEYDEGDEPVGLTQAFPAIPEDEPPEWETGGKWKDFDWNSSYTSEPDVVDAPAEGASAQSAAEDTTAADQQAQQDQQAPQAENAPATTVATTATGTQSASGAKRGRHGAHAAELSPRMKQSKRTRRLLIVLLILLIIVLGALGYFAYKTFSEGQRQAVDQTQEVTTAEKSGLSSAQAGDAVTTNAKLTDVPNIAQLLGMTQDEAVSTLQRGATITANRPVNEEGSAIKSNITVALTEEPADSKTGTPSVYLGLSEDGHVLQAGYSASAAALGFGSLSFADAINNEHVIEKTLAKVGVNIPEGSAVLPSNKSEYSEYASDGTTVVRERCSFSGDVDVNGRACTWSSVLSYDYTTQVLTGNLSDTVRVIYAYVTAK